MEEFCGIYQNILEYYDIFPEYPELTEIVNFIVYN
jgi:uncharacterized protein Usg